MDDKPVQPETDLKKPPKLEHQESSFADDLKTKEQAEEQKQIEEPKMIKKESLLDSLIGRVN